MTDLSEAGVPRAARVRTNRRLAIIVSMILVIAGAAASLFLVRTVDGQLADIGEAYEARRQARELMISVVEAETGQRGYLLTQDGRYLEPYNRAVASIDDSYRRLLDLIRDNPAQSLRIEGIDADLEAKRQEFARTIELTSRGDADQALALVRSGGGEEVMRRIRAALRAFIAEEDARLIDRNDRMEIYRQWLVAAILASLGAAATLAYALFNRAQQQVAALSQRQTALVSQNEQLEAHIRARTAEVEEARIRAERERARLETLLQDTNHRIGNSLATVSSLLGLQVARTRSEEVRSALEAAQGRVHAIASAHRRLRLGDDLETTSVADFLDSVVEDLSTAVPQERGIVFHRDFHFVVIPARDATTIGILVSELVANAIKHAFSAGQGGHIWIRFNVEDGVPRLAVEDDGAGLPPEQEPSGSGLGAVIIKQLGRQFGGTVTYSDRPGGGTSVVVTLPDLEVSDAWGA